MNRVVVLGRGGAGKSTAAQRLGQLTGLPVVELDKHFWTRDLTPLPQQKWIQVQQRLTHAERWILDGDLGPWDAPAARLAPADTVIVLDFGLLRCAWRAARRSRENGQFWWWVLSWRRRSRTPLLTTIAAVAVHADVHVLRTPAQLNRLLNTVTPRTSEAADPGSSSASSSRRPCR